MALIFPPLPRTPDATPAFGIDSTTKRDTIAARLVAALDEEWWVFRDRTIGDESVPFLMLHRAHGIAVASSETVPHDLIAGLRRLLDEHGFSETFHGMLPIVAVGLDDLDSGAPGDVAISAFGSAPALSIDDSDWVEWVADQLTVEADLMPATAAPASSGLLVPLLPPDDDTAFARPDAPADSPVQANPAFIAAVALPTARQPDEAPDTAAAAARSETKALPAYAGHRPPARPAILVGAAGIGGIALASIALALFMLPSTTREPSPQAAAVDTISGSSSRAAPAPVSALVPPAEAATRPPAPVASASAPPGNDDVPDGREFQTSSTSPDAVPPEEDHSEPAVSAEQPRSVRRRHDVRTRPASRPASTTAVRRFRPWWQRFQPRPEQPHINRNQP